jgi:hypothetical protein
VSKCINVIVSDLSQKTEFCFEAGNRKDWEEAKRGVKLIRGALSLVNKGNFD